MHEMMSGFRCADVRSADTGLKGLTVSVMRRQVALAALEVTNALVCSDVRILEASCLLGLVPAVLRYAFPNQPLLLRTQAAAFAHALCHGSAATASMFVACQVCF